MTFTFSQAKTLALRELQTQAALAQKGAPQVLNNPLILGPPGNGKTAIARTLCAEHFDDRMFAPINTGENADATDVSGVPVPGMIRTLMSDGTSSEKTEAKGAYMEWVLNRYAAMATVYPTFLLFDDLDKAPPPVQGALIGVTGNRTFRDKQLHPGSLIMALGNRVTDDMYANDISESMRTRMTILEMEADIKSFAEYAQTTGEIHDVIIGYLTFKPAHLYQPRADVLRFPTPRCWWEVSQQFERYPNPEEDIFNNQTHNWSIIVSTKCGAHVASDFWAWFSIIKSINVNELLRTGKIPLSPDQDRRIAQYAAVFAVARELNAKGVGLTSANTSPHLGLPVWVDTLEPEMRTALSIQLSRSVRSDLSVAFPKLPLISHMIPTAVSSP